MMVFKKFNDKKARLNFWDHLKNVEKEFNHYDLLKLLDHDFKIIYVDLCGKDESIYLWPHL